MWNQLTVVFLEVSENVRNGIIDEIRHEIEDIREIRLLNCGNNMLYEVFIKSRHLAKDTHFLVVYDYYV